MKRILSFLLALLLVCNLAVPAMAVEVPTEANTFYLDVDKTSVRVGETVTLSVYSNTEMTNMASNSVLIEYDETVFALDINKSTTVGDEEYWGVIDSAHEQQGKYTGVSMFRSSSKETIPNGLLATIQLTALKASANTSFAIFKADASWLDKTNNDAKINVDVKFDDPIAMTVTEPAPTTYTVTLPEIQTGYSIVKSDDTAFSEDDLVVAAGNAFSFKIVVDGNHEGIPVVKAGTQTLDAVNDVYTVTVNANVEITVTGITEKQEEQNNYPFTTLTTDKGNVLNIEEKAAVSYQVYSDVPYFHVTIPQGTTSVYVTYPSSEKPFVSFSPVSSAYEAYGYYAETEEWTGGSMTFVYDHENTANGYTITLPLNTGKKVVDTDGDDKLDAPGSFVAIADNNATHAVAVERDGTSDGDYSPICFFTFEYADQAAPATYTVTLPETRTGYSIVKADSSAITEADLTVAEGGSFSFKVVVDTANGYEATSEFAVTAGDTPLTATEDVYTVTVNGNVTIGVAGIAKKNYTVTLPTSIAYTAATRQETTVAHGESFTFTVTPNNGYAGIPVVKVGNDTVDRNEDGSYTITVTGNVSVVISGIELIYEGYGVRASQDRSITAGEEAEVSFVVEAESQTEGTDAAAVYNAYDLTVTYNADVVNYQSCTAANASDELTVTASNGTIRIQGYGPDKNVNTAPVTLLFTGKALGTADVKVTDAKVDIGAHAIGNDAPEAAVLDDTTVITVTGYSVELDEGLKADSTVAENGVDYTFKPTDADNYTYVVTYTVGGQTYTAQANADGSYTIPGEHITGNIQLSAQMTPKTYKVTVNGQDVTGGNAATYNTPYIFTVNKQSGYTYTVAVLRNNETYTGYSEVNGTYTIPGTDITGDFVITVTKTEIPVDDKTVEVQKPAWVTGNSTATKGQSYTFTVPKDEGYSYGELKVTMGGSDITSKLTVSGNSYTISSVTGNIVISITRTSSLDVDVVPYITLKEGKVMYLVTASGKFSNGYIAKYDGQSMYWSEAYKAYAWLVVSSDNLQTVKAAAENKVAMAQGTAAGTVDYTGDVNGTKAVDINDAQLTYDMYNAKYDGFTDVSMQKFLNADVNHDQLVDVLDARAVVTAIQ